jgi:predicted dehydrogenase
MKNTILLAGSGNIGRRHLQALAALGRPLDLIVIEPDASARDATATLLAAHSNRISLRLQARWEDLPPTVATAAAPRRGALEALLAATQPSFVLLEKVLFTTHRDLDECGSILSSRNIQTVINCGRRGFPDYDRLRDVLKSRRDISMSVVGSNWNMCSNGIHFLDLYSHLIGDLPTSLSEEGLEPEPVLGRHPGCVEFYGTLTAYTSGGGTLQLTNLRNPGMPLVIELTHEKEKWRIEEGNGRIIHQDDAGEEYIEPFEVLMVSNMGHLYTEILDERRSRLPSYQLSATHHRLFIDAIRRKLGMRLSEDLPCPIS